MEKMTDIQDAVLRAILIEQVRSTSKYSKKLENYILLDLSQKNLISLLNRKFYLTEAYLSTDIEREHYIEKFSTPLLLVSTVGIAILSGGGKKGEPGRLRSAVNKTVKVGSNFFGIKSLDPETERGGYVAGGITAWLIAHSAYIISKAIKALLMKAFLTCNRNCERSIPNNKQIGANRKLLVRICTLKCRLSGMEKVLAKLHSESAMCDSTNNPWKCKSTIFTRIGEIQERYQEEKKELTQLTNILNNRIASSSQTQKAMSPVQNKQSSSSITNMPPKKS